MRLYARDGGALLAARAEGQDAFTALDAVMPWERFRASVEEAEALARPEEVDAYAELGEHHAGVRRWAPAFLGTLSSAACRPSRRCCALSASCAR